MQTDQDLGQPVSHYWYLNTGKREREPEFSGSRTHLGNETGEAHKAPPPGGLHSPENPWTVTGQSQEQNWPRGGPVVASLPPKYDVFWPLVALYSPPFECPSKIIKKKRRFVYTQGPSPTKPSFSAEPAGSVRNDGGRQVGAGLSEPTGSLPAADFQFLMTEFICWVFGWGNQRSLQCDVTHVAFST